MSDNLYAHPTEPLDLEECKQWEWSENPLDDTDYETGNLTEFGYDSGSNMFVYAETASWDAMEEAARCVADKADDLRPDLQGTDLRYDLDNDVLVAWVETMEEVLNEDVPESVEVIDSNGEGSFFVDNRISADEHPTMLDLSAPVHQVLDRVQVYWDSRIDEATIRQARRSHPDWFVD